MDFKHNVYVKHNFISAISDFKQCLNNKKHIDALILDFAKAFDKISHTKLCHKLSHYGINSQPLSWIKTTCLIDLKLLLWMDHVVDQFQCSTRDCISTTAILTLHK